MHGVIVMLGAPLAGKGTQAKLLSTSLGIPTLSSGDLFRKEVASGSELGSKMKSYMDQGLLIPNELTSALLSQTLMKEEYERGVILDGYPRNISHVGILEDILLGIDMDIEAMIYLDVAYEELKGRLKSRRTCTNCSATVASDSLAVCPSCGIGKLVVRADDEIAVFERRYKVFADETLPLVTYLQQKMPRKLIHILPTEHDAQVVQSQTLRQLSLLSESLDSYPWLEMQWQRFQASGESDLKKFNEFLLSFRNKALYENRFRKTGTALRRFIYLQTTNVHKWREHAQIFDSFYGIEVLRIPPCIPEEALKLLLLHRDKSTVPVAVIRETSNLFKPGSKTQLSSLRHGVSAVNRSHLRALSWDVKNQKYVVREYQHETPGSIDLTRREPSLNVTGSHGHLGSPPAQGQLSSASLVSSDPSVFSWDDIFVAPLLPYSYHELRLMGIKHSSRDQVISDFIKDTIYYKDRLSLAFSNMSTQRVVDFGVKVSDLVNENEYYNNPMAVKFGYRRLIEHTLQMGAFWRSAENRRQNTYWCPGLNGGIPVVSKKDDKIHEDVFRAHDFGHYIVPDLIFTGNDSVHHRRAYVAYRMISEATTMTMADMLFVHALKTSGIEYDFTKRRIYPLFCALGLNFEDEHGNTHDVSSSEAKHLGDNSAPAGIAMSPHFIATLKQVVRANYVYCLQGDDSEYKRLLKLNGQLDEATGTSPVLESFKEKYMPFFVEDFRWTEHNYDNMVSRSEELSRWWNAVKPLRSFSDIPMVSVDDFLESLESRNPVLYDMNDKEFVDSVFEHVFDQTIAPVFQKQAQSGTPDSHLLFRSFTRWITGQLAICSKFAPIYKQSLEAQANIIELVVQARTDIDRFDLETISTVRSRFESYLNDLVARSLINKDDQRTFAEVYPLFDPYYVSYDKETSAYEDLKSVSARVFSQDTHRNKQIELIQHHIGHTLTPRERRCVSFMTSMIELGGGQVLDGLFVSRPGIMLLTQVDPDMWSAAPHDQIMLSFLIAGVSVETSLEFCAHKEARVARLTSSKTNAMSMPLFRVQGESTIAQRQYLAAAATARNRSVSFKEDGLEYSNMLLPAAKATALCYSMKLADFHKLLIGRVPEPGNETEVRYVASRICSILHSHFPQYILPLENYLGCNNKDKLAMLEPPKATGYPPVASSKPSIFYQSTLTPHALRLFKQLNIDISRGSSTAWAEFRSRLTYLAFQTAPGDAWKYLHDMVFSIGHTSVLDGFHVVIDVVKLAPEFQPYVVPSSDRLIVLTLKELFAESHRPNAPASWVALFDLLRPSCPFLFDRQ